MTPTPSASDSYGKDEHPEVTEVSAFTEGLLSPRRSATIRAHLADCELCADVRTSLEEIRDALGTLPGPARMPAELAGRIDAALAAEALLDSSGPRTTNAMEVPAAPASVSRETEPDQNPGSAVSRETGRRPSSRAASLRPPGRGRAPTGPGNGRTPRRPRRRLALIIGAGAVAILGLGGLSFQFLTPAPAPQKPGNVEAAAVEKRVQALVAESPSQTPATPETKSEAPANTPMHGGATSVPSCVREGIDRTESPIAVDEEVRYRGDRRFLVVLPHEGGDGGRVDAYVVDAACVKSDTPEPGDILLKRTYVRH